MKSDQPDELKDVLLFAGKILVGIFIIASLIFGLFYIIPTPKRVCLDSENPRRYIPETYTCQEYVDGQWGVVESSIEYNEAWKEGLDEN